MNDFLQYFFSHKNSENNIFNFLFLHSLISRVIRARTEFGTNRSLVKASISISNVALCTTFVKWLWNENILYCVISRSQFILERLITVKSVDFWGKIWRVYIDKGFTFFVLIDLSLSNGILITELCKICLNSHHRLSWNFIFGRFE